jgi:ribosome-associated translation inhibitor RaiA
MELHLTTKRCELTPSAQKVLERHLEQLRRRLRYYDPDLLHLELAVERHARKKEYRGSIRLSLGNHVLPAKRNRAETLEGLLKAAFEDLEEQLDRFRARVRREYAHERKRASLPQEVVRAHERALLEERELLDRALAGDREAFDRLIEEELPGLRRAIERALLDVGAEPTPEQVEHILADVLAIAFRELPRKPARWSLGGWLAWIARREMERESAGVAVAQSVEEPA